MVPLIIGGAMMAGGTAMNMFGTSQRDKATRRAMADYQSAVNAKAGADLDALMQHSGILSGFAQERQGGVGDYLHSLQMSQMPTDDGFQKRVGGTLSGLAEMTGNSAGGYAYEGAPRAQSEYQQGQITQADNKRIAEAMLAQHQTSQIDEREKMAGHRMAFGDLLRGAKSKTVQEKFQLAQALRDLDWQRKTSALQGQMDEAQRKGQMMSMLGGLGTQAGGMLATYGLSGGGGAGGGGGGAPPGGASGIVAPEGIGSSTLYNTPGYTVPPMFK